MNASEPVPLSQVSGDGEIIPAWLDYYSTLGVVAFQLIVHGSRHENAALYRAMHSYPIVVIDEYEGQFQCEEQAERLNRALDRRRGRWVIVVNSDEFVEFPYSLRATIQVGLARRCSPPPGVTRLGSRP